MFHWICPECGREIPPAMKECPACDPAAAPLPPTPRPMADIRVEPEMGPDVLLALAEGVREAQAHSGLVKLAAAIGTSERAADVAAPPKRVGGERQPVSPSVMVSPNHVPELPILTVQPEAAIVA